MDKSIKSNWKTDWSKCCLCQQEKSEDLKSPVRNPTKREADGYTNIATNIPLFVAINALPIVLDPARLDEGGGIEETLRKNNAKYHQSCRLLFNNTKLQRAEKRAAETDTVSDNEKKLKKQRTVLHSKESRCFVCEKDAPESHLRQAMTMKLNERLNQCAKTLNDGRLLSIFSAGDVVAQELKYHPACLVALYNRERSQLCGQENVTSKEGQEQKEGCAIAFSELVTYIIETSNSRTGPCTFRLADLVLLYKERLDQLGIESQVVNSTRLKDQLLTHLPELEAYHKGRDVLLAFHSDIGTFMVEASKTCDAINMAKSAAIIRKEMLAHKWTFEKTLEGNNIEEAIPPSLLEFVCMIEHGADIKSQIKHGASKSDLAIAQLLQYNCFAKYKEDASTHRHSKDRETPLAVYVGLSVFAKTRKRHLVDMLHENGLSISYDRVLEISVKLGEAVVNQYVEEGVVCPPVLRKGLFTTAAMDNIDHNPTATTAQSSFHGTSISVFQHPSHENKGETRASLKLGEGKLKKVPDLPEAYINVQPANLKENPKPPVTTNFAFPAIDSVTAHLKQEFTWLEKVNLTEEVDDTVSIAWSAHHASQMRAQQFEVSITSLLPLLRDEAHSPATIKHVMSKIRDTVAFLNPGQIPVVAADQPLYALAKQIQWKWPEYGEDKIVIMFGGLHIEMAALRSAGTILHDSGWSSALSEAGIASSGTAESFLVASSITRTRQAHQITACSLHKLMKAAYNHYCNDNVGSTDILQFENWCEKRRLESPQFCFWDLIMSMELTMLTLVRSFREADFGLYREALAELLSYFFANNNINYARWLTIHLRDMVCIDARHPEIAKEFHRGNFVVHKSERKFSGLPIDQAHEQNNAVIKGDGGAIGLTEDESALRRWMVSGPEVSRLVSNYETVSGKKDACASKKHHEETGSAQRTFIDKVTRLCTALEEMGNPFEEDSADLLTLDTKDIAEPTKAEMVKTHIARGKQQFKSFMEGLKKDDRSCFYEPIKKNKVAFFKHEQVTSSSKEKIIKEDCQLFSRLFISCQRRECDLHEFFQYENQSSPASLSDNGKLCSCQKSQLVEVLEDKVTIPNLEPQADAIVIDGAAMVNASPPGKSKNFDEYARENILPKVEFYSRKYKRTDIVFDVYRQSSLKNKARSSRGKGIRRRVSGNSKTPTNWKGFLRDSNNKTELFNFLADKIAITSTTNIVIVTKGDDAMVTQPKSLSDISPCSHEEADSRIFVHAKSIALEGSKSLMIKANDTDVVVIAMSVMLPLKEIGIEYLWIAYGQGLNTRWIPVHQLVENIGTSRSSGMPFFHAFTGCDVVSAFRGKGKKCAWQTWDVCDEVSSTFTKLSQSPLTFDDSDLHISEKFVVTMYDRSSTAATVNEARLDLFARKQRSYLSIPPTQASLKEHAKRAAYQAGMIWGQTMDPQPDVQSPAEWGWIKQGDLWQVHWTDLPPIATSCQELTKCGCKKGCSRRCKCYRCGLTCTALCSCMCQN